MWGGQQGGQSNWGNTPQGNPWGGQGMQGFQGGMGGGMHGGGHQHWQKNAFYNQNQRWGQGNYHQMPQWQNKHDVYVPPIQFRGGCSKCHGTGTMNRRGMPIPCRNCYRKQGICPKCFGGGTNYFNGRPCRKCQGGHWQRRGGHRSSSSSSSSDDNQWGGNHGGFGGQGGYGGQNHGSFGGGQHQGYVQQGYQQQQPRAHPWGRPNHNYW